MKWSEFQRLLLALNVTHTCSENQVTAAGEEGHAMDTDEIGEGAVGRAKSCGNTAGKATEAGLSKRVRFRFPAHPQVLESSDVVPLNG